MSSSSSSRPPSARGRCYECGADARGRLGATMLVEWAAAYEYDRPAPPHRRRTSPYFRLRLCAYHAATTAAEDGGAL